MALIPSSDGAHAGFGGHATLGVALLDSGALPLLELPEPGALTAEQSMLPCIKSASQLRPLEACEDPSNDAPPAEAELQPMAEKEAAQPNPLMPLELSQAGRSVSGGMTGWTPRAPHAGMHIRSSLAFGNSKLSKQAISFAPSGAIRREDRASVAAVSPGRSTDGVSYTDRVMQQLMVTDSCCAPFAAGDPLAVSNCHMLKFLAASGVIQGRQEDVVAPQRHSHKLGSRSRGLLTHAVPVSVMMKSCHATCPVDVVARAPATGALASTAQSWLRT